MYIREFVCQNLQNVRSVSVKKEMQTYIKVLCSDFPFGFFLFVRLFISHQSPKKQTEKM